MARIAVIFIVVLVLLYAWKKFHDNSAEPTKFEAGRTYFKARTEFKDGTTRASKPGSGTKLRVIEAGKGYVIFNMEGTKPGDSFYRKAVTGKDLEWYERTFDLVE